MVWRFHLLFVFSRDLPLLRGRNESDGFSCIERDKRFPDDVVPTFVPNANLDVGERLDVPTYHQCGSFIGKASCGGRWSRPNFALKSSSGPSAKGCRRSIVGNSTKNSRQKNKVSKPRPREQRVGKPGAPKALWTGYHRTNGSSELAFSNAHRRSPTIWTTSPFPQGIRYASSVLTRECNS